MLYILYRDLCVSYVGVEGTPCFFVGLKGKPKGNRQAHPFILKGDLRLSWKLTIGFPLPTSIGKRAVLELNNCNQP